MNFLEKIKQVLLNPSKFFYEIEKEKGIKASLIYLTVLVVFFTIMSLILLLIFKEKIVNLFLNLFNLGAEAQAFSLTQTIEILLISAPISILSTFIVSGILYVWLLIYKGENKLYTYSRTPSLVFGWIPIINWFSWVYSLVLLIIGTHKIYKFSKLKSTLIYLIPLFLLLVLFFILFIIFLLLITAIAQNPVSETF